MRLSQGHFNEQSHRSINNPASTCRSFKKIGTLLV